MRTVVGMALCGVVALVLCLWVMPLRAADDVAPPAPAEKSLADQVQDLQQQVKTVMSDMNKLEKKHREDPEVAAAKKTADEAADKYKKLLQDKVAADPEGVALKLKYEELSKKLLELKIQLKAGAKLEGKGQPVEGAAGVK